MDHKGIIESGENKCMEWCSARYPKKGESVSGDLFFVKENEGSVLLAAMDGLGHGEKAHTASKKAVESLKNFKNESLISLANRCHDELLGSRGVVMSLALISSQEDTLTWLGVGNVEGILLRGDDNKFKKTDTIISCRGILGYKLPLLKASMISITPGDLIIFTTDGVKFGFEDDIDVVMHPRSVIDRITAGYVDHSDDALILAARYKGLST